MTPQQHQLVKQAYFDIINGYSSTFLKGKKIFIKHFGPFDFLRGDEFYNSHYESAISNSIPTNADKLSFLKENNLWSEKDDSSIEDKKTFITNLKSQRSKLAMLKSQHRQLTEELIKAEKELLALQEKKLELLGITAESMANKKANEYNIINSFFNDKNLTQQTFNIEEFDDLDELDFGELVGIYNKNSEKFFTLNLKRVALSSYFLNFFYLCDNDAFKFYGKPIIQLTFYQAELMSQGCYFKNILSEMKDSITPDMFENPDEIISTYESKKNMEKYNQESDKITNRGLMGATKQDYIDQGMGDQLGPDLGEIASKKGGSLNIWDILQAQGEDVTNHP